MKQLFNFKIKLNREWENTSRIQEAVSNMVQCALDDEHHPYIISMISTELLENAIKYSASDFDETAPLLFSVSGDQNEIIVEVQNKIDDAQKESIVDLDKTIQWIRGYQNPFEAYVERMKRVSKSSTDSSKLGMVRIAYEGSAIIDFILKADNYLSVSATVLLT